MSAEPTKQPLSTNLLGSTTTQPTDQTKQSETQLSKYYCRIVDLPLNRYIDVLINSNLNALTISGFPTPEQLTLAWSQIQAEYAEANSDAEYRMYYFLMRDITCLEIDISLVENGVKIMSVLYVPETAAVLNSICKTKFAFDPNDADKYLGELKRCLNIIKSTHLRFEMLKSRIQAMEAKFKEGKKPTAEYFMNVLITLSDHAKISLNDSMSVYEFCERLRRFNKYCETVNKT